MGFQSLIGIGRRAVASNGDGGAVRGYPARAAGGLGGSAALAALLVVAAGGAAAQPKKIVVTGLTDGQVAELRESSPEARVVPAQGDALLREIADADAMIGTINAELVRAGKKLRWVQIGSAGVERYLHLASPDLRDSDIVLTNGKIIQGPEIADHAFALLLTLTRGIAQLLPQQRDGLWRRGKVTGMVELQGKTAVVVGVGGIGTQIAVRAKGFGMHVIGVDPKDIPYAPHVDRLVKPDRIDTVLPQADVLFVSAPHTPESDRMIGARQFELMKPGAYFVAVSRGRLYDMDALVKALDSKRLAGAGVDVTEPEPLPENHPLWQFPNVVITPHIAGGSDNVGQRRMDLFKENIRRFVNGEPLLNVVDKQKGY
jgi:phosphoglycerate dehydrogenase-like enzyme